jgi:(4S)-4-hydroxy-5-phosphonooxypentane-2,3-dione isomerase
VGEGPVCQLAEPVVSEICIAVKEESVQILLVHIQVKPESIEDFKQITLENARNSVQEAGIARFDVLQQNDDPTRFVLVEVYRDEDAPAKHKETAHYLAWRDRAVDMMAEPRYGIKYSNLFPDESGR